MVSNPSLSNLPDLPAKSTKLTPEVFGDFEKDTLKALQDMGQCPCSCGQSLSTAGKGGNKKANGTNYLRVICKNKACPVTTGSLRTYLAKDKENEIHALALKRINELDLMLPKVESSQSSQKIKAMTNQQGKPSTAEVTDDDKDTPEYDQAENQVAENPDAEEEKSDLDAMFDVHEENDQEIYYEYESDNKEEIKEGDNTYSDQENDGDRANQVITPTPKSLVLPQTTPPKNSNRFAILAKRPVDLTPQQVSKKSKVHEPSLRDMIIGLQEQLKEQQKTIDRQQRTIAELTALLAKKGNQHPQMEELVTKPVIEPVDVSQSKAKQNVTDHSDITDKGKVFTFQAGSIKETKPKSTKNSKGKEPMHMGQGIGKETARFKQTSTPLTIAKGPSESNKPQAPPDMNIRNEKSSWADIAKKGIKNLTKTERKRVLQGGQERNQPQEFFRIYIQYKARTSSFEEKKKKVQLFLKITKLNKTITDYSIVKDMIEIYVCDAQLNRFSNIINEHKLVLVNDFNPADFSSIEDNDVMAIVRGKTIKRVAFLVSKSRSDNHRRAILEGFDIEMQENIHKFADNMFESERTWNKAPRQNGNQRSHQQVSADMFRQRRAVKENIMMSMLEDPKEDLAAAVGGEAAQ